MRIGLVGAGRIGARHATALCELPRVRTLVVADAAAGRAQDLAKRVGAQAVDTVDELFAAGLDGLVVAATTDAHAELVLRGAAAGLPVFCEKPIAPDIDGTFQVVQAVNRAGVPVQVGFQRRFDPGHIATREAVESGRLGWLHTVRSCTFDPAPPPREYIRGSGGLFRDCAVHDFDAVRFITGREVVTAVAAGANRGDEIFSEYDDVDTATAVLTLDDGTIAVVSATRYNAAGYDVRFEALGSKESIVTGLDSHTPLTPVQGDACATPYNGFLERFADAYDAELRAFTEVVAGTAESPCRPEEALEAFYVAQACDISRHEGRAVELAEVRR
jgi:myo-inositol 2-dehydrogenase/D-chiro-inositol 1-dehydrogenase